MEQIKIEGNLIVRGNLLCEKDGKVWDADTEREIEL